MHSALLGRDASICTFVGHYTVFILGKEKYGIGEEKLQLQIVVTLSFMDILVNM